MRANQCVFLVSLLSCITGLARAGHLETYFPLHVGNSWTYLDDAGATKTFTIIAEREMGGHTYYEFNDFHSPCGFPGYSTGGENRYLFRPDPDSDVLLQYDPVTKDDVVRYDFSGEMWGPFGNQMSNSGFSHSVPAGNFDDCVLFEMRHWLTVVYFMRPRPLVLARLNSIRLGTACRNFRAT